jgi:hypothetical protein
MIPKSLLLCLSLLLAYVTLLAFAPGLSATQAQWQQNLHKAEQYLYDDASAKNVIIGTSIAERIVTERIHDCDNLSLSGLTIFEGLSLLRHKDKLPANVYIETNVLARRRDGRFSETLFSPVPFFMRRHVIALRADKRPLALIGQSFGTTMGEVRHRGRLLEQRLFGTVAATAGAHELGDQTPALDDRMLALQIHDYSERPNETLLNGQLQLLTADVSYLMSKGVRIVFFEMPVNPKLTSLPQAQLVRDRVHEAFPGVRYHHIELPPDSGSYVTTDGIHLSPKEAARYTRYFFEEARKIGAVN